MTQYSNLVMVDIMKMGLQKMVLKFHLSLVPLTFLIYGILLFYYDILGFGFAAILINLIDAIGMRKIKNHV
jgi:hypothetical protein